MTDVTRPVLRLLFVDDHEVVRQGLAALLDRREGFQVVAEAGTVAEAVAAASSRTWCHGRPTPGRQWRRGLP